MNAALLILAFIILSCNAASAATFLVTMRNNSFVPSALTINVGDIVTWTNTQGRHDTICGSSGQPCGDWNSNVHFGRLMSFRDTFSFTFPSPGTFPYYCGPHWEIGMTGTITVLPPPNVGPSVSITSPSNGQTFSAPANIIVQANASDSDGNVTQVQFFMNGTSVGISGQPYQATANNLGPGNYTFLAVATDNSGAKATNSVSIIVTGSGPVIIVPPISQTVTNGSEVNFTFSASGTGLLRYQWAFNNVPIEGATGTSLVLTNVSTNASGTYTIGVTNDFGGTAASATLTVTNIVVGTSPQIVIQPQSQTNHAGSNVTFTVAAIGTGPLRYQWFFARILSVAIYNDFEVTNELVNIPDQFNVLAILGPGDSGFTNRYKYYVGDHSSHAILNATNPLLEIEHIATNNAGLYFTVVSNEFGQAVSHVASLKVVLPPDCTFSLSPEGASFSDTGGLGTVTVYDGRHLPPPPSFGDANKASVTQDVQPPNLPSEDTYLIRQACGWGVTNTNSWITIESADEVGSGYVWFRVATNSTGLRRFGNLVIAGQLFPITQNGFAKNDFDHDGQTDLLWQNADGRLALWQMSGTTKFGASLLRNGQPVAPGWQIIATQDYNADGKVDILWQHADGRYAIWYMDGANFVRAELLSGLPRISSAWRFSGFGDFTGDAKDDFIFRHSDGYLLFWQMNGKTFVKQQLLFGGEPVPTNWQIAGVADFTGDNKPDILWQNTDTSLVLWQMGGTAVTSGTLLSHLPKNVNASITGLNDLNQDGKTDLIWRHADGHLSAWFMNGTNRLSVQNINGGKPVASAWKLVAPKN